MGERGDADAARPGGHGDEARRAGREVGQGASVLRLADLSGGRATPFRLEPGPEALARAARALGIEGLRKLRLEGEVRPTGAGDWTLTAHLGATVVQACVVTLEPVTSRIEEPVRRVYAAHHEEPGAAEVEMPDHEREPLPEAIDLAALAEEALGLALPAFPRARGAELGEAVFAEPGAEPMTDEAARPFAGLSALRDKLGRG